MGMEVADPMRTPRARNASFDQYALGGYDIDEREVDPALNFLLKKRQQEQSSQQTIGRSQVGPNCTGMSLDER
jgi:hypothetical protein